MQNYPADKKIKHLTVAYDEASPEVEAIYESNFRMIPEMLRQLADGIEKGQYGAVGEVTCVVMGDTVEVFGWGPHSTGASTCVLLQAGAQKMIDAVKNHGA